MLYSAAVVAKLSPALGEEDKNMNNENRNEEAVSPVIATILMVAITVVLAGVLYVWASSLSDDSTGGGLDKYQFSDRDAAGTMSDAGGEALVHIKMTSGEPLSWSVLKVTIVVEGGNSLTCVDDSKDTTNAQCTYATDATDNNWDTAEEITISEAATDLCDGTENDGSGCNVDVTLTKMGVGGEDDVVLRNVEAFASAN